MSTEYLLWEDKKRDVSLSAVEQSSRIGFTMILPSDREGTAFSVTSTPRLDPMLIAEIGARLIQIASYNVEDSDQFWKDIDQHMKVIQHP